MSRVSEKGHPKISISIKTKKNTQPSALFYIAEFPEKGKDHPNYQSLFLKQLCIEKNNTSLMHNDYAKTDLYLSTPLRQDIPTYPKEPPI